MERLNTGLKAQGQAVNDFEISEEKIPEIWQELQGSDWPATDQEALVVRQYQINMDSLMRNLSDAYGKLDEEEMEQLRTVVGRILNGELPTQEIEDWHAVIERTKRLSTLFQNLDRERRSATADEKNEVERIWSTWSLMPFSIPMRNKAREWLGCGKLLVRRWMGVNKDAITGP